MLSQLRVLARHRRRCALENRQVDTLEEETDGYSWRAKNQGLCYLAIYIDGAALDGMRLQRERRRGRYMHARPPIPPTTPDSMLHLKQ